MSKKVRKERNGSALLQKLSYDLSQQFGRGFSTDNLEAMRKLYLTYPVEISETLPRKSEMSSIVSVLAKKFTLTWSHYRLLLRLDESFQREFYETESIRGNWSVRQLGRQIQSLLYERTALSKRKEVVIAKAHEKPIILKPEDEIKDPYILEFLALKDEYSESQLEQALIKHLENFLLELGIGFTFGCKAETNNAGGETFSP